LTHLVAVAGLLLLLTVLARLQFSHVRRLLQMLLLHRQALTRLQDAQGSAAQRASSAAVWMNEGSEVWGGAEIAGHASEDALQQQWQSQAALVREHNARCGRELSAVNKAWAAKQQGQRAQVAAGPTWAARTLIKIKAHIDKLRRLAKQNNTEPPAYVSTRLSVANIVVDQAAVLQQKYAAAVPNVLWTPTSGRGWCFTVNRGRVDGCARSMVKRRGHLHARHTLGLREHRGVIPRLLELADERVQDVGKGTPRVQLGRSAVL
jgi:hypothetical protein